MAAKLKIGGAWSGVMEVELETWTVRMLREEVASRSNCGPELINLICGGKVLKDGDGSQKLTHLGLKNNSKILVTRVSLDQTDSLNRTKEICMAEEERSARLARIKAAAAVLAKRHVEGSLPVEDFNIELEDQSGQKVDLGSETDQKAAMMGLMLHTNAKQLIRKQNYKDALEVLEMGEEAFSLCNPKVMELIDNVPILQIDMVWCYFLLRDISWLSVAGLRLAKARQGIERAHGKDSSRLRLLQAGCHPEIALHLRLELLEGVVAYHSGQLEKSRKALTAAQDNFVKLQVPDEALSLIMSMGYKENDAKRALRMTNHEVANAIEFLIDETAKRVKKQEEDIRRRNEIKEQKRYGETPLRKAVDLQRLEKLVSIGYEKELAAEALRRNENDFQMALDDLINPDTNSVIQLDIESKKRKRQRKKAQSAIDELVSMGFERGKAVAAVQAFGTLERAESYLLDQLDSPQLDSNSSPSEPHHADSSVTDAAGSVSLSNEGSNAGPSSAADQVEERDVEMEDELAEELRDGDVYSDYDIDVSKEGEALNEYLSLLASTDNSEAASSSQ